MPRVYISYRDKNGTPTGGGDPVDLCAKCWSKAAKMSGEQFIEAFPRDTYGLTPGEVEEDLRSAFPDCGDSHPNYAYEDYHCHMCRKELGDADD